MFHFHFHIFGGKAYPCLKQLIAPFRDNGHLTRTERYFNQRLLSAIAMEQRIFSRWEMYRNVFKLVKIIIKEYIKLLELYLNLKDIKFSIQIFYL